MSARHFHASPRFSAIPNLHDPLYVLRYDAEEYVDSVGAGLHVVECASEQCVAAWGPFPDPWIELLERADTQALWAGRLVELEA